jgi:hypothetical protein
MEEQEIPDLLAEDEPEKEEEQKHEELKNYFRLELIKNEKDRKKLN